MSEFRVEVICLIPELQGVVCSLYLPTELQDSLNTRDSDTGLICNEILEAFVKLKWFFWFGWPLKMDCTLKHGYGFYEWLE